MLATVAALIERGLDLDAIARSFVSWLYRGEFIPWGVVFDVGNMVREAIERLASGVPPSESGVYRPSNGALRGILPVALYLCCYPITEAHLLPDPARDTDVRGGDSGAGRRCGEGLAICAVCGS